MRYLLLLAAVGLLTGCYKPAEESQRVGAFKVEKLFTHEGCTVYRFSDSRPIYYTDCTSTHWSRSCGKNCTHDESVETR